MSKRKEQHYNLKFRNYDILSNKTALITLEKKHRLQSKKTKDGNIILKCDTYLCLK